VRGAALAALALGALSCAKGLSDLQPYPCAKDGTCPDGLSCTQGNCVAAALDSPCDSSTTCSSAGSGVSCNFGACVPACALGVCGAGRVCSDASGSGSCLFDCSNGQLCPNGLTCANLFYQGKRGCTAAGAGPAACASVDTPGPVVSCNQANFNVSCGNGQSCPTDSICITGNKCLCGDFFNYVDCSGRVCTPASPCGPNWFCAPQTADPACVASQGWVQSLYTCRDGRRIPVLCNPSQTDCESRCQSATACDPVANTCTSTNARRCRFDVSAGAATPTCTPGGRQDAGDSCVLVTLPDGGADDTCGPSLFCTRFQAPQGQMNCLPLCYATQDCGAQQCLLLSTAIHTGESVMGLCVTPCAFFTGCDAGTTCSISGNVDFKSMGYCRPVGTSPLLGSCQTDSDCGPNLSCNGNTQCVANCDLSHPCPDGGTCTASIGTLMGNGAGLCL
jgi:hypothetical protein